MKIKNNADLQNNNNTKKFINIIKNKLESFFIDHKIEVSLHGSNFRNLSNFSIVEKTIHDIKLTIKIFKNNNPLVDYYTRSYLKNEENGSAKGVGSYLDLLSDWLKLESNHNAISKFLKDLLNSNCSIDNFKKELGDIINHPYSPSNISKLDYEYYELTKISSSSYIISNSNYDLNKKSFELINQKIKDYKDKSTIYLKK